MITSVASKKKSTNLPQVSHGVWWATMSLLIYIKDGLKYLIYGINKEFVHQRLKKVLEPRINFFLKSQKVLLSALVSYSLAIFLASFLLVSSAKSEFAFTPLTQSLEAVDGYGEGIITITNPSEKPIRLKISFSEWTVGKNAEIFILETSDLTKYLKVAPAQLTINPKESHKIRILVSMPDNFPEKEYKFFTNILEITDERVLTETKSSNINFKINSLISSALYVRKGNSENFKSNFIIQELLLKKKDEKFKYELQYKNSGNKNVREILKIKIYNLENEIISERTLGSLVAFPTEGENSTKVEGEFAITGANEISAIEFVFSNLDDEESVSKIFDLQHEKQRFSN